MGPDDRITVFPFMMTPLADAEDDDRRSALPSRRQAGARRRVCPFRRSHPAPRPCLNLPTQRDRRGFVEEGGFLYDSDAYNDELPYWTYDYGRPHLIIPHTLDDNDTRLARGLGWGQAEDFFISLRDSFDALYREGEQTPKMMTVALHCRLAGKPARAAAFARFVDHVLRHDRVWICRRNEIAEHWRRLHPAVSQL